MHRIYQELIDFHFEHDRQMIFLSGPRQVGKTTLGKHCRYSSAAYNYLDWDVLDNQRLIINGAIAVAERLGLNKLQHEKQTIVFDELHKYPQWREFLKGFFDLYEDKAHMLVTGSANLNTLRRSGDSLMGRYFPYYVHPFSVAECVRPYLPEQEISAPKIITDEQWNSLWQFGGYPEPFLKNNKAFFNRWKRLRHEQLFRQDITALTQLRELNQIELFSHILPQYSGQLINYSNLAKTMQISINTIKRWLNTLADFYYCFLIRPWNKNIIRSLVKEPKLFLWDWSDLDDMGQRAENFIALHLLKAVHFWTDFGFGSYELFFIRDKEKREVDFLVSKNNQPWFLVEVKAKDNHSISEHLYRFQQQTGAAHAFQVVIDMPYVDKNCFQESGPIIVPARTFLSQLI